MDSVQTCHLSLSRTLKLNASLFYVERYVSWYIARRIWRYHNTMVKRKRTNNPLQSTTQNTKDWAARTPLKTGGELRCCGRVSISCSSSDTHLVSLVTNPVISHEWGEDHEVEHIWRHLWHSYSVTIN